MGLANQNCPKCGHTLESINMMDQRCLNANCDLESREDLVDYCEENNIGDEEICR